MSNETSPLICKHALPVLPWNTVIQFPTSTGLSFSPVIEKGPDWLRRTRTTSDNLRKPSRCEYRKHTAWIFTTWRTLRLEIYPMSAGAKCSYVVRATAPASTCTISLAISAHKFLSRRLTYHCKMQVKYPLKLLVAFFSWQITTLGFPALPWQVFIVRVIFSTCTPHCNTQELPADGALFTYDLRLILFCQRFRLRLDGAVVENDRVNLHLSTKCQAYHFASYFQQTPES